MVVAGKLGLYSMLRFHIGLFPVQAKEIAPVVMVLAVIVSAFYVVIDVVNWFVKMTQDPRRVHVIKYTQDSFFFYIITSVQGTCAAVAVPRPWVALMGDPPQACSH